MVVNLVLPGGRQPPVACSVSPSPVLVMPTVVTLVLAIAPLASRVVSLTPMESSVVVLNAELALGLLVVTMLVAPKYRV